MTTYITATSQLLGEINTHMQTSTLSLDLVHVAVTAISYYMHLILTKHYAPSIVT